MFKAMHKAEFNINGHQIIFMIDGDTPIYEVQTVLNKITHFCVERLYESENEAKQEAKDKEAMEKPQLESAPVEEESQPVEE